MKVFIFGNPDLHSDSLPLRILPQLKKIYPCISFEVKDPNENWEVIENSVVIDTVTNLKKVKLFSDLEHFSNPPRISLHDFDVISHLRYLKKIGRLGQIKIIGLPPMISEKNALDAAKKILANLLATGPSENGRHNSCRDHKPG